MAAKHHWTGDATIYDMINDNDNDDDDDDYDDDDDDDDVSFCLKLQIQSIVMSHSQSLVMSPESYATEFRIIIWFPVY